MKKFFVVGIIAVAFIGLVVYQKSMVKPTDSAVMTPTTTETQTSQPTGKMVVYKDGQYDAVGEYVSPAGPEQLEVKLTIKDNKVEAAEVVNKATIDQSIEYQNAFIDGYKPLVIGKSLNDLKLSKVSGSSLTPRGFNDAVEKIKSQAKV